MLLDLAKPHFANGYNGQDRHLAMFWVHYDVFVHDPIGTSSGCKTRQVSLHVLQLLAICHWHVGRQLAACGCQSHHMNTVQA